MGAIQRKRRTIVSAPETHDVTALLIDWRGGDAAAVEKLMPLVHGELRRIRSVTWRANGRAT